MKLSLILWERVRDTRENIENYTRKGNETEIRGRNETIFNFMLIYSYCCSRTNYTIYL